MPVIYSVRARPVKERLAEFHRRLTDGTIEGQEPDGREILRSMRHAKISRSGTVQWREECFCSPPLRHERETVYDVFFTDLEAGPVSDCAGFEGRPFFEFLEEQKPGSQ